MLSHNGKASDLIDQLALNEECIARLYQVYSNAFPILHEFWTSLADEEIEHACWIRNMSALSTSTTIFVNESRFNGVAIKTFREYLDKEFTRANQMQVTLIEALSITLYIEQSLIESKFFEIFETDSADIKSIFSQISAETTAHRRKVKKELEKINKNN